MSIAAGCLSLCLGAATAQPQEKYPSRPVRIIMPSSPGGPSDAMLRGVAELLAADMGQPFVVENRPGADGIIAGSACNSAPPDGYTLCLADSFNMLLLPLTKARMPYDPAQWTPIAFLGYLPTGLWSSGASPLVDAQAIFTEARRKPGAVTIGSWGRASSAYLHAEYLHKTQGLDFNVIAYKSPVAAFQGTVAGEIELSLYGLQAGLPMVPTSKVRLLAINTEKRLPSLPDVPTFTEVGLQNGTLLWFGLFAPPGTPAVISQRLNERIAKLAFGDQAVKERLMTRNGILVDAPAGRGPQEIVPFLRSQEDIYKRWVGAAGVQPE